MSEMIINTPFVEEVHWTKLIEESWSILDVRSPGEFADNALPGSVNIPILTDEERAQIGTTYKHQGREAAIELGSRLVSGETKELRLQAWMNALAANPCSVITCWRGGLRSEVAQQWLAERGVERPRLKGGTKAFRRFLLRQMDEILSVQKFLVISGETGAGKTLCLRAAAQTRPVLDLEHLAKHRGSAFGAVLDHQPSQASFENLIAAELLRTSGNSHLPLLIEDESRMVGSLVAPQALFERLRASPVIFIDEPLAKRVENTLREYVLESDLQHSEKLQRYYRQSLQQISKRLGGERYRRCLGILNEAIQRADLELHRECISILLNDYYDPLYRKSFKIRQPQVIFRGSRAEVSEFLGNPSRCLRHLR
ncbi:MAG: tRNA 2-selenouridine(34) synthase MnmH, partial [Bdellovibrio sp.]